MAKIGSTGFVAPACGPAHVQPGRGVSKLDGAGSKMPRARRAIIMAVTMASPRSVPIASSNATLKKREHPRGDKRRSSRYVCNSTRCSRAGFSPPGIMENSSIRPPIWSAMKASMSAGGISSDAEHPAWIAEVRKVYGKPEPFGLPASLPDQRQVFGRKCVVPDDRRRVCRRIEQRRARLR